MQGEINLSENNSFIGKRMNEIKWKINDISRNRFINNTERKKLIQELLTENNKCKELLSEGFSPDDDFSTAYNFHKTHLPKNCLK